MKTRTMERGTVTVHPMMWCAPSGNWMVGVQVIGPDGSTITQLWRGNAGTTDQNVARVKATKAAREHIKAFGGKLGGSIIESPNP